MNEPAQSVMTADALPMTNMTPMGIVESGP